MAYNKFTYGKEVLLDLSNDDLTSETYMVANGKKYHGRDGVQYTGTASLSEPEEVTANVVFTKSGDTYQDFVQLPTDSTKTMSKVTVPHPSAMVPENIRNSTTLFGIVGTLVPPPNFAYGSGAASTTWYFNKEFDWDSEFPSMSWDSGTDVKTAIVGTFGDSSSGKNWIIANKIGSDSPIYTLIAATSASLIGVIYSTEDVTYTYRSMEIVANKGWNNSSITLPDGAQTCTLIYPSSDSRKDYAIASEKIAFGNYYTSQGGNRPSYLLDSELVANALYFNPDYSTTQLDSFLQSLSYITFDLFGLASLVDTGTDEDDSGLCACRLLWQLPSGSTGYIYGLVVIRDGDVSHPTIVYSTEEFELSSSITGGDPIVAEKGWNNLEANFSSLPIENINNSFKNIMDELVTRKSIQFGDTSVKGPIIQDVTTLKFRDTSSITDNTLTLGCAATLEDNTLKFNN